MKRYATVADALPDLVPGMFIRFGGHGIIDGLKHHPCKYDTYKVVNVEETVIHLKRYRQKRGCALVRFYFDQECETYTTKEYKLFPIY